MIRHVVAFQLKGGSREERSAQSDGIKQRLLPLKEAIPDVLALELGDDLGRIDSHWDLVLISEHPDDAALEAYQANPLHLEASKWVNTVVESRAVVDYEIR